MKGYMKKAKVKRMLAMLLTAVMVITLCIPQNVEAGSASDVYKGTGNITDLLTDFQYVIKGDARLYQSAHTVGSVAIGGNLTADNTIGDCAQRPSYANNIASASVGNATEFLGSTRDFYYGTTEKTLSAEFIQNPGYMDVPAMFPSLIQQSKDLYANNPGVTGVSALDPSKNFQMITLDFSTSKTFTIDYEVLKAAKGINFVNFDVDDLSNNAYTINVVNVAGNEVFFNSETYAGAENSGNIDLFVNGSQYAFLGDLDDPLNGIQCNLSGMKLIWNFPDATGTIRWVGMGGHLVAPQANVSIELGRFEGGVIASSLQSTAQAHYFPYNSFGVSESGDDIVAKDIFVQKTYLTKSGTLVTPTEHAVFTLYKDYDATTKTCSNPIGEATVDGNTGYATFDAETLGLECDATYYVKETYAPKGFEINDTVYECAISVGGLVTYKDLSNGSGTYSSTAPVYENLMTTYTEDSEIGTLVVTVEDIDNNRAKVAGAVIKVIGKDANDKDVVIGTKETASTGTVSFTDLEPGDYKVSITTIPEGYIAPSETTVTVNVQRTSYHTFELTQEKETVTVWVREDTIDGPVVSGGIVQITGADNQTITEYVGSTGKVIFENKIAGEYTVTLVQTPAGYNDPAVTTGKVTVLTSDDITDNEYTFVLTKQVGTVVVDVVEEGTETSVGGSSVTITLPDGSTITEEDTDGDGKVTFTGIPAGTSKVQITTAPDGYILVNPNPSESVVVTDGSTEPATLPVKAETQKGNLTIQVVDTDTSKDCDATDANKVTIKITASNGTSTTKEVYVDGDVISLSATDSYDLLAGEYTIEVSTPDGWKTIETTVDSQAATNPNSVKATVVDQTITAVVVTVNAVGSLKVIVQEEETGKVIPGATIKVTDSDGTEYERTTGTDGSVTIESIPTGSCTIDVITVPNDYEKPDGTTTTINQNAITTETINVNPYGNIVVTVKEQGADTKISGASITVESTDSSSGFVAITETTGSTGQITFEDVPLGEYKVTINSVGEEWTLPTAKEQTVTVTASADGEALFEVTKTTATLTVNVIEEDSKDSVDGAVIKVTDAKGTEITVPYNNTTANGKVEITDLPVGDYKVTIISATGNYVLPTETTKDVTVPVGGTSTTFELTEPAVANGELKVSVYLDDGEGNKTACDLATVDIIGLNGLSIGNLPTGESSISIAALSPGNYTTIITVPAGYVLAEKQTAEQTKEVNDGACTEFEYVLIKAGAINVTVKDSDDNPVGGIEVAVVDGSGNEIATGETLPDGTVSFDNLPIGEYDVIIKDIPSEYDDPTSDTAEDVKITINADGSADFVLPLAGDITVTVYEIGTTNEIPGAEVELRDASDKVIGSAQTTDAAGQVSFNDLKDATYKVVIISAPNGYSIVDPSLKASEVTAVIDSNGRNKEADFYVDALGNMEFTVIEDGTGNLIPDAKVEVKDANGNIIQDGSGNDYFITSSDADTKGKVTINGIPAGKYTVTVLEVPTGYKVTTPSEETKTVTVVKNDTAKEQAKIVATTTLVITVVDEDDDTELLAGSKITVEDQYGNVVDATATDGKVTLPDWPVTTDPSNPTKVTITKVPGTHVLPTEESKKTTTVVVEQKPFGEVNNHIVEAPQKPTTTGDLIITVRDEETNAIVPGAIIIITYPDGSKETVETDSDGKINKTGVVTGTYSVEIEAVPSGFTEPTKSITKIPVIPGTNPVEIVIKKPSSPSGGTNNPKPGKQTSNETISRAPKTGDITYIPVAVAMMVISLIGLAGITVYRKKSESKR